MICRGGIVVGGWGGLPVSRAINSNRGLIESEAQPVRWLWLLGSIPLIAWLLVTLGPARIVLPPLIESDYCYQLIAADRMYEGQGFTSLQPIAPHQPWAWGYDFGFLTQWPVGYSFLVWLVRIVTGATTIVACRWIGIAACAAALAGWFSWIRRSVPNGMSGVILATASAGCAVPFASVLNPSTDALIVALLPFVLLITNNAIERAHFRSPPVVSWTRLAMAGTVAGALVWIRYAAIFIPFALAIALLINSRTKKQVKNRGLLVFVLAASLPIAALLAVNRAFGPANPIQTQLNLGTNAGFHLTWGMLADTWWHFTDLGLFKSRPRLDNLCHWLSALWPGGLVLAALAHRTAHRKPQPEGLLYSSRGQSRRTSGRPRNDESQGKSTLKGSSLPPLLPTPTDPFRVEGGFVLQQPGAALRLPPATMAQPFRLPHFHLGATVLLGLLLMLITAAAVFSEKFDYINLQRYYLPVKPLYFLLFVGPLLWVPNRVIRFLTALPLLVILVHTWTWEWQGGLNREVSVQRETTSYGRRANCFTPGAEALFQWLKTLDSRKTVIFSNFQDYITLETGLPAYPIPRDRAALDDWLPKISAARNLDTTQVLFVLDPNNRWRSRWLPRLDEIIAQFDLCERIETPSGISAIVFEFQ